MNSKALRIFNFNLSELCLYSRDKLILAILKELKICNSETLSIISGLEKQKLLKVLRRLRKRGLIKIKTMRRVPYYSLVSGDSDE